MSKKLGRNIWKKDESAVAWKSVFETDPVAVHIDKFEKAGVKNFLKSFQGINERSYVIDTGCGQGKYFSLVSNSSFKVGVDISLAMLKICKQSNPSVNCVVADAEHLPFREHSFNIVISARTIQHMPNQEVFLYELSRILVSNGAMILLFYNAATLHCLYKNICSDRIIKLLFKRLPNFMKKVFPFKPWPLDYDQYNTFGQIENILTRNSVFIKKTRGITLGNIWMFNKLPLFSQIKRFAPGVLQVYTMFYSALEPFFNDRWPFKYLMDKILIYAEKK